MQKSLQSKKLYVQSTVPQSGGFGSSAALATALSRYFYGNNKNTWKHAHQFEMYYHGKSSGIDTGLANGNPFCVYSFQFLSGHTLPQKRKIHTPSLYLLIMGVRRKYSTRQAIANISWHNTKTKKLLHKLSVFSQHAISLISQKASGEGFGTLATKAHQTLRELGVYDQRIDKLLTAGLQEGAVGGKLSGSGGTCYLICLQKEVALHIKNILQSILSKFQGIGPWIIHIGK